MKIFWHTKNIFLNKLFWTRNHFIAKIVLLYTPPIVHGSCSHNLDWDSPWLTRLDLRNKKGLPASVARSILVGISSLLPIFLTGRGKNKFSAPRAKFASSKGYL